MHADEVADRLKATLRLGMGAKRSLGRQTRQAAAQVPLAPPDTPEETYTGV